MPQMGVIIKAMLPATGTEKAGDAGRNWVHALEHGTPYSCLGIRSQYLRNPKTRLFHQCDPLCLPASDGAGADPPRSEIPQESEDAGHGDSMFGDLPGKVLHAVSRFLRLDRGAIQAAQVEAEVAAVARCVPVPA